MRVIESCAECLYKRQLRKTDRRKEFEIMELQRVSSEKSPPARCIFLFVLLPRLYYKKILKYSKICKRFVRGYLIYCSRVQGKN